MNQLAVILIFSWSAGAAAFIGGVIARVEGSAETETKCEIIHRVIAFRGGILVSAVAFALVPEGNALLHPVVFASGGILYLIFQDIAPQSKMRRHWTPPIGAVLGFVVGMLGKKLIG
jgi:peptidoglycan/LPS O-acetylase OafA/YrhL